MIKGGKKEKKMRKKREKKDKKVKKGWEKEKKGEEKNIPPCLPNKRRLSSSCSMSNSNKPNASLKYYYKYVY